MKGNRSIAHMDLDSFFVSVERLFDSRLNGKPILIRGSGDCGVVAMGMGRRRFNPFNGREI